MPPLTSMPASSMAFMAPRWLAVTARAVAEAPAASRVPRSRGSAVRSTRQQTARPKDAARRSGVSPAKFGASRFASGCWLMMC
eukprot:scaffold1397_cov254-Pinguiococcus_pyrenoidosus.AAC.72